MNFMILQIYQKQYLRQKMNEEKEPIARIPNTTGDARRGDKKSNERNEEIKK